MSVPAKRSQLKVQLPSLTGRSGCSGAAFTSTGDARRHLAGSPACLPKETRFPSGHRAAGAANAFGSFWSIVILDRLAAVG